jgi:hypothetical protein
MLLYTNVRQSVSDVVTTNAGYTGVSVCTLVAAAWSVARPGDDRTQHRSDTVRPGISVVSAAAETGRARFYDAGPSSVIFWHTSGRSTLREDDTVGNLPPVTVTGILDVGPSSVVVRDAPRQEGRSAAGIEPSANNTAGGSPPVTID